MNGFTGTCFKLARYDIALRQYGVDRFAVSYGKQINMSLNYSQAAHELGKCIMHALACADKLDNRESEMEQ